MWEKLAWDAARKYRMASFTEKMGDIVKTDQKATDWLDSEERSCWARAYFDHTCKCDEITNNFSESCNSWILKMRDKPLVQFVDMYNLSLVKLMYDGMMVSRELGDYDVVVPTVLHIIKKREAKYKNYKVSGVSDHISLVQNTKNKKHYCVDLEKKTSKKSIIQDKLQGNFQQQQKAAPPSVQQQVPPQQQQAPPNVQQQAPQQQQRVTRSTRRAPQQQQAPPQQQQAPQQQQRATRSTRRDWLSWFEASGASNQESSTPPPSLRQT
ncbi:hypothetical protein IFM89_020492 [Coptis chinensis]|uniref:Uncharacterized protein n=1 Tax=Coptis chinensis TaxID=261450 RepID=A0A835H5V2_9MAGN|nr:hypothetical protein IFM89_020492 [Coptis chinensis]